MSLENKCLKVGILGASGYVGVELIRILSQHPNVQIVFLTAERHRDKSVRDLFPHLGAVKLPVMTHMDETEWKAIAADFIFCGLPHGTTQRIVSELLDAKVNGQDFSNSVDQGTSGTQGQSLGTRLIDLSADFRLDDAGTYAAYYGHTHNSPRFQMEATYGLTEVNRKKILMSRLIACPGCYPTSALLPLIPLVREKLIDVHDIIIDAKSGVTGAGRTPKETNLYAEVAEGVHAYGIAKHRHAPEIEQELSKVSDDNISVSFTPHLVPMNRGILSTIYVRYGEGCSVVDLVDALKGYYIGDSFVSILSPGFVPATRHVRGSNHCIIGVSEDRVPGRAIIFSVIDNLVKGASGQAIQNMNLMSGLPETIGLSQLPLFP